METLRATKSSDLPEPRVSPRYKVLYHEQRMTLHQSITTFLFGMVWVPLTTGTVIIGHLRNSRDANLMGLPKQLGDAAAKQALQAWRQVRGGYSNRVVLHSLKETQTLLA